MEEFKWIKPGKEYKVKTNIFGRRSLYTDDKTKIVFMRDDGDYYYVLKRKEGFFWKQKAAVNAIYCKDLNEVLEQLIRKERVFNEKIENER